MDTFEEIRDATQDELNVSDSSSLFDVDTIDRVINDVYFVVTALYRWPQLQDAKTTTTQTDINYYDAPGNWRPQSIWRLEVNGVRYGEKPDGSPIAFEDFLTWREDHPNSTDKKWSMQWLRYFISPTPTVAGLPICIWGAKNPAKLTESTQETIFSSNMPECNYGLALEAAARLQKKADATDKGQLISQDAQIIFATSFNKWGKDRAKSEKIQPGFSVPDFFGRSNSKQTIGNFDFNP